MRCILRTQRLKRGLTLRDVAKYLGLTKSAYGNIESGRRGTSPRRWDALEDLFGIDQRDLR